MQAGGKQLHVTSPASKIVVSVRVHLLAEPESFASTFLLAAGALVPTASFHCRTVAPSQRNQHQHAQSGHTSSRRHTKLTFFTSSFANPDTSLFSCVRSLPTARPIFVSCKNGRTVNSHPLRGADTSFNVHVKALL